MLKTIRNCLFAICTFILSLSFVNTVQAQQPQQSSTPPRFQSSFSVFSTVKTGIILEKGEFVHITAEGLMDFGGFTPAGGPDGIRSSGWFSMMYNHFVDIPHGALMAQIGNIYYYIGTDNKFVVSAKGELVLFVNDKEVANNTGKFVASIKIYRSKTYQQRLDELNAIRKSHDLDDLVQWLTENPDWTSGLPELPPKLTMPPDKNNGGLDPTLWAVEKLNAWSPHVGNWEVRQVRDVPGQKFPGVGVQGLYAEDGTLIQDEGTPDIARPCGLGCFDTWNHLRTDYALYNRYIVDYGPLVGEIKYRELYQVDIPEYYLSPEMYEAQKKWEQEKVDKSVGPEP